jgi:hypothetical protein
MEHRGKTYTIVQGIKPNFWKWTVHLDEQTKKSGEAASRAVALAKAVAFIDQALAPKKVKLTPPQ